MNADINELLGGLRSEDATERRYAAEDLGGLNDPAAVQALVKTLEDPVVGVRGAAAESLLAIGGRQVCEKVIPLLDPGSTSLRN